MDNKDDKTGKTLRGTFPVIPTPFRDDGGIDTASLEKAVEYIVGCGADGVVFPGLASEYAELSSEERLTATAIVGRLSAGRLPFVVGASAPSPEEAIEYSIAGAEAGAVCAMVMAPLQFANDRAAMIDFYRTLAERAQIPIMLQNAPPPMGAGLPVESVWEILRKVPQIHYVKEETMPCGQRIEKLLQKAPARLKGVFGGAGGRYIVDELNRGALGTVPASELTEMHIALVDAHGAGDLSRARNLFSRMLPILNMQAVYRCSLTKQVLFQKGIIASTKVRAAGPQMDTRDIEELAEFWSLVEEFMGPLQPNLETSLYRATH